MFENLSVSELIQVSPHMIDAAPQRKGLAAVRSCATRSKDCNEPSPTPCTCVAFVSVPAYRYRNHTTTHQFWSDLTDCMEHTGGDVDDICLVAVLAAIQEVLLPLPPPRTPSPALRPPAL